MTNQSEKDGDDDQVPGGEDAPPRDAANESIGSASRSMAPRPSLIALLRAGLRALRRYPGLVAALYLLQVALSAGAALIMVTVLTRAFGARPMFDRAMEGDLAALIACFSDPGGAQVLVGLVAIGAGAAMVYGALSWFLSAGLIAVLLDTPSRGREVVRWFGAAGASNFFPFLRLALWALLPTVPVALVAAGGLTWVDAHLGRALDLPSFLGALALGLSPALALHWVVAAAVDYARVDLVRHPGLSSMRALLRGFGLLARRRLALVHTLLYGLVFIAATVLSTWIGMGGLVPGLAALMLVRQAVGLTRFVAHVGLIAGQVELACTTIGTPLARRR
ncbi:MAG TPA: hypothetical protein VK698_03130 [Kofleriaceae bacterium]|nr:hypothetical protein [Kofleriaceae bacterium]